MGAREAHRQACFIKVQVQDLSDCQVALSFLVPYYRCQLFTSPLLPCTATFLITICCSLCVLERSRHTQSKRCSALRQSFVILRNIIFLLSWKKQASFGPFKTFSKMHVSALLLEKISYIVGVSLRGCSHMIPVYTPAWFKNTMGMIPRLEVHLDAIWVNLLI